MYLSRALTCRRADLCSVLHFHPRSSPSLLVLSPLKQESHSHVEEGSSSANTEGRYAQIATLLKNSLPMSSISQCKVSIQYSLSCWQVQPSIQHHQHRFSVSVAIMQPNLVLLCHSLTTIDLVHAFIHQSIQFSCTFLNLLRWILFLYNRDWRDWSHHLGRSSPS